jgi:hypothetical protein
MLRPDPGDGPYAPQGRDGVTTLSSSGIFWIVLIALAPMLGIHYHALTSSEPNDRRAAPLTDEIRGALDDAWRRSHGIEDVEGNGDVSESVPRIGIEIQKMDSAVGEHTLVVAHWWVAMGEGNDVQKISCHSVLVEKAEGAIDGLVGADQHLFKILAGEIAMALSPVSSPDTLACPKA